MAMTATSGARPASEADDLTGFLCRQLAAALGYESVGPQEDFFELGGDSVAAAALMTAIAARCGIDLPISTVARHPTMAALAAQIEAPSAAAMHPSLLPVDAGGDGTPLFMVHGLTGQAFSTRYLKDRIGPRRPIYGLQALPQRPAEAPIKTVPEIAEEYIAAIRSVHPNGPYILASTCAGVLIAWEMAQKLRAAGVEVPGLIAVDPPSHIGDFIGGEVDRSEDPSGDARLLGDDATFRFQARESIVLNTAEHDDYAWLRRDPDALEAAVQTAIALRTALLEYRPVPYDGQVVVLCSQQAMVYMKKALARADQRKIGWPALVRGPSQMIPLRGSHRGLFRKDNPAVPDAIRGALKFLAV